jgi:hypothetical protein
MVTSSIREFGGRIHLAPAKLDAECDVLAMPLCRFNAASSGFVARIAARLRKTLHKSLFFRAFRFMCLSGPRGAFPALQARIALLYAAASEACFAVPW